MDSIEITLDHFPPEVIALGIPVSNLSLDDIHAGISSHEFAISYLENLIFHHKRAIARYRGSFNEIIPCINKMLPVEIIAEIFLNYRALCSQPQPNQKCYPDAWLKLAHVCRYWRNIALTTPQLFGIIELPMKSLRTRELVRLSKQSLVDVRLHPDSRSSWEELGLLLPHTRSLTIDEVSNPVLDDWIWPESRDLIAFACIYTPPSWERRYSGPSWFDRDLCDIMPNLKYLNACCTMFGPGWPSHSLPHTLHTLILEAKCQDKSGDVHMILQKLIELPQLKNLSISGLSRQAFVRSSDPAVCPIGHMDSLRISGELSAILTLLSHIRSVDRLDLNAQTDAYENEHRCFLLFAMLRTKLAPIHPSLLAISDNLGLACVLQRTGGRRFSLRLTAGSCHDKRAFPLASFHVELTVARDSFPIIESAIGALSSRLSLVTTCELHFDNSDRSPEMIQTILRSMPSVTSLNLSQTGFDYLGPLFPTVLASNDEHNLILPRLREIQVDMYNLYLPDCHPDGPANSPLITFCAHLRDALQSRKEHKAELPALKLVFGRADAWYELTTLGILDEIESWLDPTISGLDIVPP